jgi:hypothetical protein
MRNYSLIIGLTKETISNKLDFQESIQTAHQLTTSEQYTLGLTIDEVKAGTKKLQDGEYVIAFLKGMAEDSTLLPTPEIGLGKVLFSWLSAYTQLSNPAYKMLGLQVDGLIIIDEVADFVEVEKVKQPKEIWDYDNNSKDFYDDYWTVQLIGDTFQVLGAAADDGILFDVLGAIGESTVSASEAIAPIAEVSGEGLPELLEIVGPALEGSVEIFGACLEAGGEIIGGILEIIGAILGGLSG